MKRHCRILIANHHTTPLPALPTDLAERGFVVATTQQIVETIETLKQGRADVVVLNPLTSDVAGFEIQQVAAVLDPERPPPMIVVLDQFAQLDFPLQANLAFDDFMLRPIHPLELMARVEFNLRRRERTWDLLEAKRELEKQTVTDFKTGLYNDRYFQKRLREEFQRARRHNFVISCMLFDFDKFKEINDRFDHAFGDFVLVSFAKKLRSVVRDIDIPARLGGDEFALLLPNTDVDQAVIIADRIRKLLISTQFERDDATTSLTMSIGIDSFKGDPDLTPDEFVRQADQALLEAKRRGRNRICLYHEIAAQARAPR
ncbi:MAG: diguanylate cyclase [Planctomycetota bacterium]